MSLALPSKARHQQIENPTSGLSATIRADFGEGKKSGEEQGVTGFVAYLFLFCFGLTFQFPCHWLTGDFLTLITSAASLAREL